MTDADVRLREWTRADPDNVPALRGRRLSRHRSVQALAAALSDTGRLRITELARGLRLEATAWVGRVTLGDLTITVEPKLPQLPLLGLLRYAYGWRDVRLVGATDFATAGGAFLDLLIVQLVSEVSDLLARGLHRDYVRNEAALASPRGRIDFHRYATVGAPTAALPCIHHPRRAATDLNGLLLSGLRHAAGATACLDLRVRLRRLAGRLALDAPAAPISDGAVAAALRGLDRCTGHYGAALRLLALILSGQSITLDDPPRALRLNGFLLDMNAFFQALLGRFLSEHLDACEIVQEERLHGLFAYDRKHNPRRRRDPQPRPDFVVRRDATADVILDAKYRDLWERPLPREMLYQLAIYALAQGETSASATLLYPSFAPQASDQVVVFSDVVRGMPKARVILRPVDLQRLERLLRDGKASGALRQCRDLANEWAFTPSEVNTAA
ncbi:MAG: hypothetical protein GVY09_18030 [Gammaproteobacteria bacterium]|jgi:5-methylcytosine-specific restriction enzyme subunit McrC|nr:hypothetical protein [Gammaproteobacteria bacterium]